MARPRAKGRPGEPWKRTNMNAQQAIVEHCPSRSWYVVLGTCAAVLAAAGIAELVGSLIEGSISSDFFVVCAGVAPLFGLAVLVDIGVVMSPVVKKTGATDAIRETTKTFVRLDIGMLVISQSAALYAVGAGQASAFLVACSVLPWMVQLYVLASTTYHRAGIREVGVSR
jgi:hypothetical protein